MQVVLDHVRLQLQRREQGRRWGAITEIMVGLALTILAPPILVLLAGLATRRHAFGGDPLDGGLLGLGLLMAAVAGYVLIAIAYGMEWWYRGSYLMTRLREIGTGPSDPWLDSTNDRWWRYRARESAAWMEIWLFIPRLVYEGLGKLKVAIMVGQVDSGMAVAVMGRLLAQDHRQEVEALRKMTGADGLAFGRVMAYLLFYEWVDVSEDGQRVWVGTQSREEMSVK